MPKYTTSQASQQTRAGVLVLNRIQTGLALGLVGIGLVIAFGGGFIVGMWYQASEQITPYAAVPAETPGSDDATQPLSFYSTLTEPTTEPGVSEPLPPAAGPKFRLPEPAESQPAGSETASPALQTRRPEPATVKPSRTPPSSSPPPATSQPAGGRYSVQVGSFRVREQAEELRGRLLGKGYAVRVQLTRIPGSGIWYRVRVGRFADRETASRAARRLENREHLSVLITDEAG
jgi:cell division protein FtsN